MSCPQDDTAGGVDTFLPAADSKRPGSQGTPRLTPQRYLTVTYSQAQSTQCNRSTQLQSTGEREALMKECVSFDESPR